MKQTKWLLGVTIGALFAAPAMAQTALDFERRDLNQEQRILQGLQSGSLTAQEAARLQNGTQRIDRMESRALRDGELDARERARIDAAQDRLAWQIRRESSDRQTANPNSPESRRMQEQMQREIHRDQRQLQGMREGGYSNREVARQEWRDAGNRQFDGRGDRFHRGRGEHANNGRDNSFNRGWGEHRNNGRDNSFNQGRGDHIRGDANRQFPGGGERFRGETQRPAAAAVEAQARPVVAQRPERTVLAQRQTGVAGPARPQRNGGGFR